MESLYLWTVELETINDTALSGSPNLFQVYLNVKTLDSFVSKVTL
jgi:hypothetical protein